MAKPQCDTPIVRVCVGLLTLCKISVTTRMAAYVQESSFFKTLLETLHKAWPLHKNDTYKLRNGPSTFGGHLICMNIPPPPKPHDLDLFSSI
jgi:hypothetical protein